jgi:hypothetical protein
MYAGPGYLIDYPSVPGSPVIAEQVCMDVVPFRGIAFEANLSAAKQLGQAGLRATMIGHSQSEMVLALLAKNLKPDVRRCGLIYADPNAFHASDTRLIDALFSFSQFPSTQFIDILLHIPATTYKRVRGLEQNAHQPPLADALKRVQKSTIKVSRPDDRHQWTFVLFSNYDHSSFGRKIGWHSIDSERGRLILDRISMTRKEREARRPAGWLFDPE